MKVKKGIFKKFFFLQLLIVAIFIIVGFAAFRAGEEFQVNTFISWYQGNPAVAMDKKGNFVITWDSSQDGSWNGIFAQRFNKNGKAIGLEFQVNTHYEDSQWLPAVAMDRKGNFVITWNSDEQDGDGFGIFAQRFNKNGKTIGLEFQVNTYASGHQQGPAVAMDRKGNFVITWYSYEQDGDHGGIFAQRFNKNGKTIGLEFQVNIHYEDTQWNPSVAMDGKGNFVITWESWFQDGDWSGIFAQRFNKNGIAIGAEFQVNTYTESEQDRPAVAMDRKGNFVITWTSWNQDGLADGIFAQRFDKEGLPIGPEFQVNTYTSASQFFPAVAMDEKGNFVITWTSDYQDGDVDGIFAQRFRKNGKAIGPEFQVNTYISLYQRWPAVAMDKKGNFVITWQSYEQDGSHYGVFAKMFKK